MQKILILRFSSIGDIVLTTPLLRCLKKQCDCEIHYLTKECNALLLENNPYVSKVHTLKRTWSETIAPLRAEKFDRILDLHKNLRSLRVKASLRRPFDSFRKLNIQKFLRVHLHWDLLPPTHIVDRYIASAHRLGIVNDGEGLDYFLSHDLPSIAELLPSSFSQDSYVAVAVGSKHQTKQMPADKWISVLSEIPGNIVLLGDLHDRKKGIIIENALGPRIFNACGNYDLNASAKIIESAKVVVSGDTGLMHIASALKRPVVSVWGNTIPAFGMTPYFPKNLSERGVVIETSEKLRCRPCSKLGFKECPKTHFRCILSIPDTRIISSILHFLTH